MSVHPDNFAAFYADKILQIDYQLTHFCYLAAKPHFKKPDSGF
jgi:hypothetical protein